MLINESPLQERDFLVSRRDSMLGYPQYLSKTREAIDSFEIVTASLSDTAKLAALPTDRPMVASRRRAWDAIEYIHLQYSGGDALPHLRKFFPLAIQYWTEYAHFDEAFDRSQASPHLVAHLTLQDASYWKALCLTSFAILLDHPGRLPELCAIWDYGNQTLDGLLERLVAQYVPGRAPPPDRCTKHLPYFKLLKVFSAPPDKRPALMVKYMDEWYQASRREPYYQSHTRGREHSYLGYWSFEAAAVTIVLGIDDSSYRDMDFYPKDLADFARSHAAGDANPGSPPGDAARARCEAGQPCPRTGFWFTAARAGSRRHFEAGEIMPDVGGDYGVTIWQWDTSQP